jgi:CO/xanthine dehydrogenase FAD-binding subunit
MLEAKVHVSSASGDRVIAFADFHRLPGDTPQRDTNLNASRPISADRWRLSQAECRGALAAAVDDRLFFAGEACSQHDYSTAHGAYLTGVAAAEQVIAARRGQRSR